LAVPGYQGRQPVRSLPPGTSALANALDHDAIKWNRVMISSFCLSMIFSENRFPLSRIML
jgi:hypothetical protein